MVRARRDLCPACKIGGHKYPIKRTGDMYKCVNDECRVRLFGGGVS